MLSRIDAGTRTRAQITGIAVISRNTVKACSWGLRLISSLTPLNRRKRRSVTLPSPEREFPPQRSNSHSSSETLTKQKHGHAASHLNNPGAFFCIEWVLLWALFTGFAVFVELMVRDDLSYINCYWATEQTDQMCVHNHLEYLLLITLILITGFNSFLLCIWLILAVPFIFIFFGIFFIFIIECSLLIHLALCISC